MGRTKGSKNGISHTPGYVAVGQVAMAPDIARTIRGRVIVGNNWQQMANKTAALQSNRDKKQKLSNKNNDYNIESNNDTMQDERMKAKKSFIKKINKQRTSTAVSGNASDINAGIQKIKDRLKEQREQYAQILKGRKLATKLAKKYEKQMSKSIDKKSEAGAKNNWQQMATRTAAGGNAYNNLYDRKITSVSGMKPEIDRTPYKNLVMQKKKKK